MAEALRFGASGGTRLRVTTVLSLVLLLGVPTLGRHEAHATDPAGAVVLRVEHGPVVLTPDEPLRLVEAVQATRPAPA